MTDSTRRLRLIPLTQGLHHGTAIIVTLVILVIVGWLPAPFHDRHHYEVMVDAAYPAVAAWLFILGWLLPTLPPVRLPITIGMPSSAKVVCVVKDHIVLHLPLRTGINVRAIVRLATSGGCLHPKAGIDIILRGSAPVRPTVALATAVIAVALVATGVVLSLPPSLWAYRFIFLLPFLLSAWAILSWPRYLRIIAESEGLCIISRLRRRFIRYDEIRVVSSGPSRLVIELASGECIGLGVKRHWFHPLYRWSEQLQLEALVRALARIRTAATLSDHPHRSPTSSSS